MVICALSPPRLGPIWLEGVFVPIVRARAVLMSYALPAKADEPIRVKRGIYRK